MKCQNEISIIICSYNGERRLPKVLDHIYAMDEIEKFVKEIIVVDNCSSDNTKSIVTNYSFGKKVLIKYLYEEKAGLSNARKKGIDACTSKWIAFLDDDNLVERNWISSIVDYLNNNTDVGALNGAVIPLVNFQMTASQKESLQASLKVLACTHYNYEEILKNPKSPFRNPIGAGMVILSEPLKELSENGWLRSAGRTKDKLISGEDGEMAYYVKGKGYKFGFCKDAVLLHEMTPNRLEVDYLNRMWYEIGRGVAIVAKNQKTKKLKLIAYECLLYLRLMLYYLQNRTKGRFYRKYMEGFNDEV